MRKIIVGAQISIDGVMQAPGGPTEDPTKGFAFGGWVMPYRRREGGEELDRVFEAAQTSSPRVVPNSFTRCSPMTWSTR